MNIRNYFIAVPLLLVSRGNFFAQNVFTYEDIIKQSVIDTNFTTILQKKISSLTFSADTEILQYLFQNPALPNQLDSQITTIAELEYQLKKFDITTSDFFNSYSPITVLNDTLIDTITRISFQFNSKTYYAYCFFVPGMVSADSVATLIIPGSGTNQSTEIYYKTGYHGPIVDNVSKYGDTYIFVKPNQDFLGIHRENKLLMDEAIVPFLINTGFSYTAYYLTQCVAFAKYLKNKYRKIAIVGLSQGGTASLYVSLQAEPAAAVIASGFSVLFEKFALMGMNQPIGHELFSTYSNTAIFNIIQNQNTKYAFSYGTLDVFVYKAEAENLYTCDYFSSLSNVTCVTGPWGHNFPVPVPTETCIEDGIRPVPLLNITADTVNLCPGDSLILFTGNAPGYLFQWFKNGMQISGQTDDSIIITASGIYKVRTSTTSNVTAFSPDLTVLSDTSQITLSVFTSSSTDSICPGDTAWLVNTYNNYSSIDWLRNDTLLPAGNGNDFFYVTQEGEYKILLTTAGGCPKYSDSVNIILYDTIRPLISMNGDTLSVSPIYQAYQWYYQGMLIPGATQNTYVTGANGDYYLVVSDFSGCSMISDTVTIVIVKNLNYPLSNTVIAKFYNKNLFILMNNSEAGKIEITLYNANGSLIHQSFHLKNALSFSVIIPLSKISYGIYLINIKTKKYSCIKKDAYLGQ